MRDDGGPATINLLIAPAGGCNNQRISRLLQQVLQPAISSVSPAGPLTTTAVGDLPTALIIDWRRGELQNKANFSVT